MHPYLFPGLNAAPRVLDYLLHQIPMAKMDEPTHPMRFTPREVIAHMADWEEILLERIKLTVNAPGSEIFGIDEGVRATELGYSKWDWERQIEVFTKCRAKTVAYLESLTQEQWGHFSVHNEKGELSADDQANMLLGHDLYHIDQLIEVLQP